MRSLFLVRAVLAAFLVLSVPAKAAAPPEKLPGVVSNLPPVQMLVPGFTVRELPVQLRNINNLVYAPDGRLFALGYDGNVHQLKDTDGDGLEDAATFFYKNDRGEIPPSIGMTWGPGGLYIASHGRVIHLKDKGDGTAELVTVTGGWVPPTAAAGSNLDAIGIAVDASGNIYFGIGCDAWNAAYRVNKTTGGSDYNLYSERGTIIKLSPDWKRRDIISTGLRFPVSLAFNAAGDLFCSEQEGATWLPNGNPFDELLHIVKGRHYGFPPRHPLYLPGVIDEPSLFDYRPQHQSTCGLHFNDPVAGSGNIFGPDWWRGDAFVAGESRGKIWRTKLVKTAAGYVAKNDLIACLSMLTIDAVPTPQGDLLVACHSGAPDWGTGPQGQGKLFKISYVAKDAPQPVLAYASSPTETRVVFDRPFDPTQLKNLTARSSITMGVHVAAGGRFESFVPGYQVVKDQADVSKTEIKVLSAAIEPDNRSLLLQTAPRTEAINYAVMLPEGQGSTRVQNSDRRELMQHANVDLLMDLTGIQVSLIDPANNFRYWHGWLPHLDLNASRELTKASDEHARFFSKLKNPSKLVLYTQVDLFHMLRTDIQPGAKLDYEYPPELVTLELKSNAKIEVKTNVKTKSEKIGNQNIVTITTQSRREPWLPLEIALTAEAGDPTLDVSWHTAEDVRPRALQLRRILLPWATQPSSDGAPAETKRSVPEIAGGDWQRGRQIFFGEQAACSKCHKVREEGGLIGPDLSNLVYRDYASVLKDITLPSAAINPDRIAYNIELKNGDSVNGVILDDTPQSLTLGQATGASLVIPKSNVASLKASAISLMPEGLFGGLNAQQQKDLMTFLLVEPSAGKASRP